MGIEDNAGIDAVLGVDGASGPGASASTEVLAIRGRRRAVIPNRGHRVSVMDVDDGGSSGNVVVVADMPLRHVDQMMVAEAARCVGHAADTTSCCASVMQATRMSIGIAAAARRG